MMTFRETERKGCVIIKYIYNAHLILLYLCVQYLQCLICKCGGPVTKRGDGSGMGLEEGEVTGHSADHIDGTV